MPYLNTNDIHDIAKRFGVQHYMNIPKASRWCIMKGIMQVMIQENRLLLLFDYLFSKEHFRELLNSCNTPEDFETNYFRIVNSVIRHINVYLHLSSQTFSIRNGKCSLIDSVGNIMINPICVKSITPEYVKEFPVRIVQDLKNKDFDSVINKSRTLLEEIFCYIIEQHGETPNSSGKAELLMKQCRKVLGMTADNGTDKRILQLFSGLSSIVESVSSLRNIGSDAHGVGSRRVRIKEREAILIANASQTISEYFLSVFLSQTKENL